MKRLILIVMTLLALAGCKKADKYGRLTDQSVFGYAYLADPFNVTLPSALPSQIIYVNDKVDSTSYVLQTATDAAGRFTFYRPSTNKYVVFSHYIKDGTEYRGSVTRDGSDTANIKLLVMPIYSTAVMLHFQDASTGGLSNLKFRLYTNQAAATVDSTKRAILNTKADSYGNYRLYNMNAGDYWVVAGDTLGTKIIKVNQKVTVTTGKPASQPITLQ
jgi:hypothetical protein